LRHACDVTLLQGLGLCYSNAQALRCCSMPASRLVSGSKSLGLHARILWKNVIISVTTTPVDIKPALVLHMVSRVCVQNFAIVGRGV